MEPGLVNYKDVQGGDVELIKKETIDEALETLIGCPLTIGHIPTTITDFKDVATGYVDHAEYDAEKGWFVCEGSVDNEQARDMISKHKGVSVGTKLNSRDFGPGGTWHNIPFGREIKKFKFHHLAIVPPDQRPRFEDAEIRLNSKKIQTMKPFQWIKSLTKQEKTEQFSELAPSARIDIGDGKSATIQEMVEIARDNMCHSVHHDDHIEHEGIRYNVGHLIHAYKQHHGGAIHATHVAPSAPIHRDDCSPGVMHLARAHADDASKTTETSKEIVEPKEKAIGENCRPNTTEAKVEDEKQAELDRANAAAKERANSSFRALAEAQANAIQQISRSNSSGSISDRIAKGKAMFGSPSSKI